MLVQPDLMLIVPSVKHVDKLLELTGLNKAKLRVRLTRRAILLWMQLRALDIVLLYLQSDLLKFHCPTVEAWQMLRHLVSYIALAQNQVFGLSKPIIGKSIV